MKNKTRNDIILLVTLVFLSLGVILFWPKNNGETVEIYKEGALLMSLDIKTDGEWDIGGLTVVVKNKEAYVINATCPDKVCQNTKAIKNKGESIICVPAKIVVKIADSKYDAVI